MKTFSTVKLDKKGRLLIPFNIRSYLNLNKGSKLLLAKHNDELRIIPFQEGRHIYIIITLKNGTKSIPQIIKHILDHNMDITFTRTKKENNTTKWIGMLDAKNCKDPEKFETGIKSIDNVKKYHIHQKWDD